MVGITHTDIRPAARVAGLSQVRSDAIVAVLLACIMLLGGYFRFQSLNWDDYARFHPDERGLTQNLAPNLNLGILSFTDGNEAQQREACMARNPETGGVGGYFDAACSDWNPNNVGQGLYVYGTLPLFAARVAAETYADLTGDTVWLGGEGLHLIWRALSAAADMLVILLVFLIGSKLHNRWVGLLAAFLYACAVFPIQQAHFGTADPIANLLATLAIYFAIRVQDSGSRWDYAGFGLAFGMTLASRVNLLPLVGLLIVAAGLRVLPVLDSRMPIEERNRILGRAFSGLLLAGAITFVTFRVLNPYAFSGPGFFGLTPNQRWLDDVSEARRLVSGIEWPPDYQWVGRVDYLYSFDNMVLWGMGLALGIMGWLGWVWSGWRVLRGRPGGTRNLLLFGWILVYFGWLGSSWVASMRYFLPLYGCFAVLAAWLLLELVKRSRQVEVPPWRRMAAVGLTAFVGGFTLLWAAMFTNIYRHQTTFVQASYWVWENVPGDFAMRIDGAGPDTPLINIAIPNSIVFRDNPIETWLETEATHYTDGNPMWRDFVAPVSGTVTTIHAPYLGELEADPEPETVEIAITTRQTITDESGNSGEADVVVARATLTTDLPRNSHPLGQPYDIELVEPWQVEAGRQYRFTVTVTGGTVIGGGSVVSMESSWEEAFPAKVCPLPVGITVEDDPPSGLSGPNCGGLSAYGDGLIGGAQLQIDGEDDEFKRQRMITALDQADYFMIPTNRRYDTHSRNPMRWPMTNRFYDALFSGELGFELVAMFQETFELGPLKVSDQYLPIYDAPSWLNELEPEEAFSVYDHPVVFIFRKSDDYSPQILRDILYSVPLTRVSGVLGATEYVDGTVAGVAAISSEVADESPTQLQMPPDMREIQYEGGTWSDRFNRDGILNTNQFAGVIAWWLLVVVMGWITWPLLFALLPGLADRGFGFAKFVGMFLSGWATWYVASFRFPVWSRGGILAALFGLLLLSGFLAWRNREAMRSYMRRRWHLLAWMELFSLGLFLVFLYIRLTNPDLWHFAYGGEKPMDFAYMNGVLRSSVFPPIDPWFAGGYLNYYYFGYVIVGVPTLITGIMPSIAYNLIVPTVAAMAGIGAFSVAFSLVSAWRGRDHTDGDSVRGAPRRTMGNPWVAGIVAMMLAVVLGNLDTPRVWANGVARLGGYEIPQGFDAYLIEEYTDDYIDDNGVPPDELGLIQIAERVQDTLNGFSVPERIEYEVHKVSSLVGGFARGMGHVLDGEPLNIAPNRWFWAPTRVISEIPTVDDRSITEMPIFTFIYGDLHAHMIAMPLIIFAVAFVFNELIVSGRDRRPWWAQAGALAVGAAAVGMSKAVNSWDWPTLMVLCVAGLGFAVWLRSRALNRRFVLGLLMTVGGFVALAGLAVWPYDYWFATSYASFRPWQGPNTPLWAYFTVHGLFLFLIVSLLLWETARWLRSVRVGALRGKWPFLLAFLIAFAIVWLVAFAFVVRGQRVVLVVLPLVAWIAVLFFRPRQSRAMQTVLVLAGLSLCITMGVEFLVLSNDIGRQNTVFKFYIQVWLFLSVAGGAAAAWLVSHSVRWRPALAVPWYAVAAVLVFAAALFPVMATRGKAVQRFNQELPVTLDGMDFMPYASHWELGSDQPIPLSGDYDIIRWLQDNVEGTPVIMEGRSRAEYQWGGRIANYTGLPSVLGWRFHQTQQRTIDSMSTLVNHRGANVNAFYENLDVVSAVNILRYYEVHYIIVGALERARYGPTGGLAKFDLMVEDGMLTEVFRNGDDVIYQVNRDALGSVSASVFIEGGG